MMSNMTKLLLLSLASAALGVPEDPRDRGGRTRVRRDTPEYAAPPLSPSSHALQARGRVGPVYTFVKTDPEANFKWGVRHRAGAQYGKVKYTSFTEDFTIDKYICTNVHTYFSGRPPPEKPCSGTW